MHALVRILLVGALVILLALIAMRELQGLTSVAGASHHASGVPALAGLEGGLA